MDKTQLWHILSELRQAFESLYGDRLAQMILYGSQARGDARPDSDIDVLVILNPMLEYEAELELSSQVISDLVLRHNAVISRLFMPIDRYHYGQGALLTNVRKDEIRF